ncbi:MAG: response regulator transcription factor [Acidobacteria bacterium]|nr:response regulator transcription factor [Acidobacteriota bacterium]
MSTETGRIPLYLVDDHALFREGLARLLEAQPDFEIAGKADHVAAGLRGIAELHPELVLLDVDLGSERALDFVRDAKAQGFAGKILIVTAGVTDLEAMQLIQAGVAGIFHKHNPPEMLCEAVRKVASGEVYLEPRYLRGLFAAVDPQVIDDRPRLTDRERIAMRCLLEGYANKEIGARLDISESSVKALLRGLFDKLGVRTRSQLVKIALDQYRDQI